MNKALELELPFAAYRSPDRKEPMLVLQNDPEPRTVQLSNSVPLEKGFIVSPFIPSEEDPIISIRPDLVLKEDAPHLLPQGRSKRNSHTAPSPAITSREEYLRNFRSIQGMFRNSTLDKLVLSRVSRIGIPSEASPGNLFDRLCTTYPDAFVHILNLPGKGIWLGATPETLIRIENGTGMIEALAGTRPTTMNKEPWGDKEVEEQKYVEDHISGILRECEWRNPEKDGPRTVNAGNIEHLSTRFRFPLDPDTPQANTLLSKLHPTPAIAGTPQEEAVRAIGQTESHSRDLYTGFLGPWGIGDEHHLFVELRCMRMIDDHAYLYLGGGITKDSDPEKEWKETEWKARTMLSVLEKL